MKKGEFNEQAFSSAIEKIRSRHDRLTVTIPSSGSYLSGEEPVRAPDLIFEDIGTGKRWVVELKASGTATLSPSVFPQLLSYRKVFGDAPKTEIVLLTNSTVPEFVSEQLRRLKVKIVTADDQNEFVQKLEEIIEEEEQG